MTEVLQQEQMPRSREEIKQEIRDRFDRNVRGRRPDLALYNRGHDGARGDWLTRAMGLTVNGRNEPDIDGFEMKTASAKTTFGDWSPTWALYKRGNGMTRDAFLCAFGEDPRVPGRFSWSGNVLPQVDMINSAGQTLVVQPNLDITAEYHYSLDRRRTKDSRIPQEFRVDQLVLARWGNETMRKRVERKFDKLGWFKCLTDASGVYSAIQFGRPINFKIFIQLVRQRDAFLDCGMHQGNPRPYMSWRASRRVWDLLAE